MSFINMKISWADKFRKIRKSLDLTQTEMSEKLGVFRTSLSHIERGGAKPTIEQVYKVINIFNVDPRFLFLENVPYIFISEEKSDKYTHSDYTPSRIEEDLIPYKLTKNAKDFETVNKVLMEQIKTQNELIQSKDEIIALLRSKLETQ